MTITKEVLDALGITRADVLEAIATATSEDTGWESLRSSAQEAAINSIRDQVSNSVKSVIEEEIKPHVSAHIESMKFGETTAWGEAKGTPLSLREFAAKQISSYLSTEVNRDGKTRSEYGSGFYSVGTRVSILIGQRIDSTIDRLVKEAMKEPINALADAVNKSIALKVEEVKANLQKVVK